MRRAIELIEELKSLRLKNAPGRHDQKAHGRDKSGVQILSDAKEYFASRVMPGEELIARTFSGIPDPNNFGYNELDRIASEGSTNSREPADFGSKGRVEFGYGSYGIIFAVPSKDVYYTDTPDYPIERAFATESARVIGAVINTNSDEDLDIGGFRATLNENGLEDIPILGLAAKMTRMGLSTDIE